jgi:hypothetical protein
MVLTQITGHHQEEGAFGHNPERWLDDIFLQLVLFEESFYFVEKSVGLCAKY